MIVTLKSTIAISPGSNQEVEIHEISFSDFRTSILRRGGRLAFALAGVWASTAASAGVGMAGAHVVLVTGRTRVDAMRPGGVGAPRM